MQSSADTLLHICSLQGTTANTIHQFNILYLEFKKTPYVCLFTVGSSCFSDLNFFCGYLHTVTYENSILKRLSKSKLLIQTLSASFRDRLLDSFKCPSLHDSRKKPWPADWFCLTSLDADTQVYVRIFIVSLAFVMAVMSF